MGFGRTAFGMLLTLAVLTACNTTDALTPPMDVGGGRFPNSPPVTDRDLQQMAETQQPVYPAASPQPTQPAPVYRQPQVAATRQTYDLAEPDPGAPPTTLDQQAAGIRTPARTAPPAPAPQAAPDEAEPQPAVAEDRTIRFLPIIGAPLQAVTPLSRQLGAEARARGLVIRSSQDKAAKHVLKGYFSAVSGGGSVTVTYVWDVLDNNGARLNRIQGQENFPGDATDPWSAVPASVMQNIATKTMDSYGQWREGP
jgi:hypothetical protein